MPDPAHPPTPLLSALLRCENGVRNRQTGLKSLLGLFRTVRRPRFPSVQPCTLFAQFSDAQGRYVLEVRLVDRGSAATVLTIPVPVTVEVADRLGRTELLLDIPGLPLPAPGQYEVQLVANGQVLGSTSLDASLAHTVAPRQEAVR